MACEHPVNKLSIEGDFVVTNSSIFLTNVHEEKVSLYETCISRKFSIKSNKLYSDTACSIFDQVKDIQIVDSFYTTIDKFPIRNSLLFSYFVDGVEDSKKDIQVFKANELFFYKGKDSMYIVKKTNDTIYVVQDPSIIQMVRVKGEGSK